ncbi:8460_t:CDS:2 [Rhizophagus irregularis]|nr:8460_t:CDS:2 [Rhizophagus irregularis]
MEKDIDLKIFDDESEDLGNNESEDFKKRRHSLQRVILRIAEEFND